MTATISMERGGSLVFVWVWLGLSEVVRSKRLDEHGLAVEHLDNPDPFPAGDGPVGGIEGLKGLLATAEMHGHLASRLAGRQQSNVNGSRFMQRVGDAGGAIAAHAQDEPEQRHHRPHHQQPGTHGDGDGSHDSQPTTQSDAARWLEALESAYTMEEQRSGHHGNVHVHQSAGVEFF